MVSPSFAGLRRCAVVLLVASGSLAAAPGCRQDDDPDGARRLFAKIVERPGFRAWPRAPGYPARAPSFTSHADAVEVFVNDAMSRALAGPNAIVAWPEGSIVVKEGYRGGDRALVAVMEKRADGWFWAEYDANGEPLYSGRPDVCLDCHAHREDYSDWVYAFELPR